VETVDSRAWRTRPVNADRDRPIAMDRAELRQGTTIKLVRSSWVRSLS
jgi:hypothetical protein